MGILGLPGYLRVYLGIYGCIRHIWVNIGMYWYMWVYMVFMHIGKYGCKLVYIGVQKLPIDGAELDTFPKCKTTAKFE